MEGSHKQTRVLSGMRPTGRLHIGHLFGALHNWVRLQAEMDAFFMIVDWHALTTGYRDAKSIPELVRDVTVDYLAAGVDPERCTLYVQSHIPEIAQLHLLLSMTLPVSWLERCPTYKDQIEALGQDIATYGFLGYPVLMTADIVIMKAKVVPVGQDQLPHLELSREIVRRFHHIYQHEVFIEPQAQLTEFPAVPGTDGRKMSKSYGNAIMLSDSPDEVTRKIKTTITDPRKVYKGDPGRPEICTVYYYHDIYTPEGEKQEVQTGCRSGALGCTDCKKKLMANMTAGLQPLYEKRQDLAARPGHIDEVLREGGRKARAVARQTLAEVHDAMGFTPPPAD
ncbi:MAG: tryptophan--tRNA ligase [Candidatus Xenobia bacterium]